MRSDAVSQDRHRNFGHASRLVACVLFGSVLLAACNSSDSSNNSAGPGNITQPEQPPLGRGSNCGDQSWIGGTTEICDGVLVYRDYIYDDHGASTGPEYDPFTGSLAPRAGNADYPTGQENTADLVKLELWIENDELAIRAEVNTLFEASQTQIAVAIDTDNDPETGNEDGEWPGFGIASSGWDWLEILDTGDPDTNLFEARFPLPAGDVWRVQAVTAQSDGTVMNVAFRGVDEAATGLTAAGVVGGSTWWEGRQAAALAEGDITAFGHEVSVADLRNGATRFDAIPPGLHQRIYTSLFPIAEGVDLDGVPGRGSNEGYPCEQKFHFLGKYQPYGIYLPEAPGPHGVQFALHGCNANHASLINNAGMQQVFGEGLNRIVVVPLGRGPVGYYSDASERDVLDVIDDVLASYPVDEDRVFAGGYSMGGYGTLRLAALYPQLFAGAVNWVGFTGRISNFPVAGNPMLGDIPLFGEFLGDFDEGAANGAVGNAIDYLGNLRHIPSAHLYAGADELVHVNTALALQERLRDTEGLPYEFFFHPAADHLTLAVLDDWQKEAAYSADRERVRNPARVTYRTDEWLRNEALNIRHDRAYWIADIRGRDGQDEEGVFVDVDLTSFGCGGDRPVYETGFDGGEDPVPWASEFRAEIDREPIAQSNGIEGSLTNVTSLTIDVEGACLSEQSVDYELTTDGPVTLTLSDGRTLTLNEAGTHQGSF